MAKKNIEEAEVQLNGESNGTKEESTEVTVTAATVKNVRIHTLEEVNCYVGGVHYSFAKGKEVSVPNDVAAILTNSQRAYRI